MSEEAIQKPSPLSLEGLSEMVRRRALRRDPSTEDQQPPVRLYDRNVRFISLSNGMNLKTLLRGRPGG